MGRAGREAGAVELETAPRSLLVDDSRSALQELRTELSDYCWIASPTEAADGSGHATVRARAEHNQLMSFGRALDRVIEERLAETTETARKQLGELATRKAQLDEEASRALAEMASLVAPLVRQQLSEQDLLLSDEQLEQTLTLLTDPSIRHSLRVEYVEAWLRCERELADHPFYQELQRRWQQTTALSERYATAIRTGEENVHTLRCEIAREELAALRPFGDLGFSRQVGARRFERSSIDIATSVLPSDWLADSLAFRGPRERMITLVMQPMDGSGKSLYNVEFNTVHILWPRKHPWVAQVRVAHELVHQIEEARPQLKVAEWLFHQRRTRDGSFDGEQEPLQSLRLLDPRGEYYDYEMTRPDHLPHPYLGKQYGDGPDSSFELLSFGIEDLLASNLRILRDDQDYRCFVYGALALL